MFRELMEPLESLAGVWEGEGRGHYPTIDSFRYRERLEFVVDWSYPLIHYEQRAFLMPEAEPSHWESGFIRPVEDGSIELSNSQSGGRVEVLRGRLSGESETRGLVLRLDSVVLAHDSRLSQTRRILTLCGDRLSYLQLMATHTTAAPLLQEHLSAELHRV